MILKRIKLLIILLTFLIISGLTNAQQATTASGGNCTGIGGSISYSVGQINYTTNFSPSGAVEQGVQHAYVLSNTGVSNSKHWLSLSFFPNPTADNLRLLIPNFCGEKLSCLLYNLDGILINRIQIISNETYIKMNDLPMGNYFLYINQDNKVIQSYSIIKN